jgi:two-component system sensor histidine kinase YesM
VENYIEHGLVRTRANNELAISSHVDNGVLMLRCRDNGRGIPPDRLAEIHAGLRDPASAPDGAGIGLVNVHRRIGIAYGESFGLIIGPGASGGTEVTLRLPWTTGE